MKRKLTLLIVLALTLCLVLAFSSCVYGGNEDIDTNTETETETPNGSEPDTSTDTSADTETYTRVDEDTILFGEYPQTEVTDSTLVSTLNSLAGTKPTSSNSYNWTSYGYYISGSVSNYMWYVDVENDGEMYRGVYFTSYRPYYCGGSSSAGTTNQDNYGYTTSTIYWFKYEPISWTILNESEGTALILCDMIIDSQQFDDANGSSYNDYAESTIRKWLNETFYNTAFNDLQKEIILTTTVDNSVASTGYSSNQYACEDTEDKVFLLSYKELTTYLTTDASRMKKTTDYAQSQGAYTYNGSTTSYLGNGYWWLRSPFDIDSFSARYVYYDGFVYNNYYYVYHTDTGVVPTLQIKEEPEEHKHTEAIIPAVAPTCTETGLTEGKKCSECGAILVEQVMVNALGHTEEILQAVEPSCTETGLTEGKKCTVCGKALVAQAIVNALGHNYEDGYCTVCGQQKPLLYTRVDEDTIEFGMYPQTEVTDSTLVSTLNSLAGTKPTSSNSYNWTSYGYYISGSVSNYMWYVDVENDGEMYRGVYFTSYRPYYCGDSSSTDNTYQDDNGYTTSNIYWFKYEPISWTILNESNGTALILCDMIIDSQEYYPSTGSHTVNGATVYANNYEYSTIRKWLNETFYNTAFNDLQKEIILTTTVDNRVASTGYSSNQYACEDTEDKVFLLSYKELTTYLTTNASRMKKTTDYAQSQGAYTSSSFYGNGYWWPRSPSSYYSYYARYVSYGGGVGSDGLVGNTFNGVVPALQIQL